MTTSSSVTPTPIVVGVLALQGGFHEHLVLLRKAAERLAPAQPHQVSPPANNFSHTSNSPQNSGSAGRSFRFVEVRTPVDLAACDALVIPGGESTSISFVAAQSGLLEPLKEFVQTHHKPTWGTCAGFILLADAANASTTKQGGQALIGGLAVRVRRNHFGRQTESFVSDLTLSFLPAGGSPPFSAVFIRAPIVEEILDVATGRPEVEVLARLPPRGDASGTGEGDIVAVRQGNIFGTSFHPELTGDDRVHAWWLAEVVRELSA